MRKLRSPREDLKEPLGPKKHSILDAKPVRRRFTRGLRCHGGGEGKERGLQREEEMDDGRRKGEVKKGNEEKG